MPIYRITAPNGKTYQIEGPEGASDAEVAQAVLAQYPEAGAAAPAKPETSLLGEASELVKGVLPGAVGLVESAAIGASALLPEDMEKAARGAIARTATAAKRPFAASSGYEQSVGRRIGEGLGSMLPVAPLGLLGVPGVLTGVGVGLASGAGEARTRAEAEGAGMEQRGTATALGTIPGAFDTAVDMALAALPGGVGKSLSVIRRALVSGGVEGATEAAQAIAQNAIARGVYKPEQALLEGAGEEGAYGAGVGVLASVLLDMAIPGRQRGATPTKPTAEPPAAGPQVPPEAPAGTQGALFGAEELPTPAAPETDLFGKPVVPEVAAPKEEAPVPVPEGQADLGLDYARQAEDVTLEVERLKRQPQTPEVKARIAELRDTLQTYSQLEVERLRAEKAAAEQQAKKDEEASKRFPALAAAPELMAMSDEVKARTQGELFGPEEMGGEFTGPQVPAKIAAAEPTEPTPVPPYARTGPYQKKLPLRGRAGELTMKDVEDTGIAPSTTRSWFEQNVVGKTKAEVQQLVDKDPTLLDGKGKRAKILRELLAPAPTPFKEAPREPIAEMPAPVERAEPGRGEPSVGVPSEPAAPVVPEPRARVAGAPAAPAAPDGFGLVPAGQPAGPRDEAPRPEPTAVTGPSPLQARLQAIIDDPAMPADVKRRAFSAFDALTDPELNETAEARRMNEAYVQRELADIEQRLRPEQAATATEQKPAVDEAAEMAERLRAQQGRVGKGVTAPARPEVRPAAERTQPIPEKLYEPVGTSEFGMKPGEKEILRGPQAMLFPMSKREELEYAAKRREAPEAEVAEEPTKPQMAPRDARQGRLDFAAEPRPQEDVTPTKTPTPSDEATLKAIDGKPMLDVAQWAAQNLPDPDQKVIAQRVLVKLRQLQEMGVTLEPVKVTAEGRRLIGAKGATHLKGKRTAGAPVTITITLNHPSNGGLSGTNPETILHELLHAATMGIIETGRYKSAAGTKVGDAVRELMALKDAVVKHFNDRVASGDQLTDFERKVYERQNNALADPHEVLVWALTNRDMQQYMESIPYKGQTAWGKFVTFVRDLLGIPAKADTALSEALRVGDTLLSLTKDDIAGAQAQTGKQYSRVQFQVAPSTEALIDSMGPLDPNQRTGLKALVSSFKASRSPAEPSYAVKFRTQVADTAATLEHRLRNDFDGKVRDSLGKVNPMGLYRQAQDYTKLLLEYFDKGAIQKDPASKLWTVVAKKGVPSMHDIYKRRDAWSAKNGYSRERGEQIASRILEGVRLDAMRTANKNEGAGFRLHLKDPEIDQLLREFNADPELKAILSDLDKVRIDMVDNMVAAGRLTKEQGDVWKAVSGYVPFDRIDEFDSNFNKIKKVSNKGISQVGRLPELIGSETRPVGNVFDNYLNTLGWMIGQTLKTDANVQALRALEDAGHAKFLGRSAQGKANTVKGYVNGEEMFWELPSKYDVMAFTDLTLPKAGWLRNLGKFSNVLRKAVTVLPPFALKQVTDDVQRAIMTSGVKNPGALLRMTLSNFGSVAMAEIRGIQHPKVKEMGALGLTGEYDFEAGKPAESILKDYGFKPRGKFETLMHRLDGITRASDLAVRKAIYDQTIKETGDQLLAQTRAREFINFRRRGASEFVGAMVTTIPFFNAYIQGMDVLYRAASGLDSSSSVGRQQARRMFWSRAAIATTLASLYAIGAGDDEEYQEMDLRTRDSNWILPGGLKLPVPTELGAIFKVIPERVVEYMRRQGTPEEQEAWEATRTALKYMYEQYVGRTVPVPQAVKPLLEAWTNYSFFTGRELEGIYQKQQDPSQRRAANTSELAMAIAAFSRDTVGVEVSPIMIDNALNGYFGSTAGLLVAVTDSMLNPTRVDRPLHKWAFLSNYMYDPVGTRRMTEFYEAREKVGRANATLNDLMKTDMDRAVKYAEEHADVLQFESAINSTLEQLERTRAYRKFLNSPDGAKSVPKEERERELQEIRRMEVELTGWLREAQASLRTQ